MCCDDGSDGFSFMSAAVALMRFCLLVQCLCRNWIGARGSSGRNEKGSNFLDFFASALAKWTIQGLDGWMDGWMDGVE